MTNQEKRDYLMHYQNLQNRIIGLTHEIEKWESIASKVNSAINGSGVSSGDNSSKVERGAVNVADIINSIQTEINSAKDVREEILTTIRTKCRVMRYREVLEMHFINGMSVYNIAKALKKEDKSVHKIINAALKELDI